MSLNSKCKSKKCGCQDTMLTTPAPCPTPVGCPTPQPCSEVINAQCIIYTGAALTCGLDVVVPSNDTVAEALQGIIDYICNNLGGDSMTSTITCGIQDYPSTVIVNSGTSYNDAIVAVSNYYCDQINNILDNLPAPGYTYEIGEYVPSQGGVIFHRYKDGTNENYLVVDTTDVSSSSFWSNIDNVSIGATAQSTWDGLSNSDAIVAQAGFTSGAANGCLISTNNGQTDWYLPAIDELSLLWQNRFNVNRTLSGNSSFGSIPGATQIGYNTYWSSTEYDNYYAWIFNFSNGDANFYNYKNYTYYVRAVRKFI